MTALPPPTFFASAERASEDDLFRQHQVLFEQKLLPTLFDAVDQLVAVLNSDRQVVFANKSLLKLLGRADVSEIRGMRPGEALNCIRAFETPGGCGTTHFCEQCGAIAAILKSITGVVDTQECRIIQRNGRDALDLLVHATPLDISGIKYTVLSIRDISDEKRRQVLERLFFHDILNTASAVKGLAEAFCVAPTGDQEQFRQGLITASSRLVDEIVSQRMLTAAERGELDLRISGVRSLLFLQDLVAVYGSREIAQDRHMVLEAGSEDVHLRTDKGLLSRVIGNMLKNALEASEPGERIRLGCHAVGEMARFWVNNAAVMPREVQLQIFQRSFSTKGPGRGLGTYGMRLLAERYLEGRIAFSSLPGDGTTFVACLPLDLPHKDVQDQTPGHPAQKAASCNEFSE
ncbi:MAG: PAS domain-containing sensor histidine kinase [Candidatus Riflebacteria bacterium]|nr:PAS domain-containing sensor histidine kinase [Candidatus Riflebacteria bacterium]